MKNNSVDIVHKKGVNELGNLGSLLPIACALFVIFVVPYFDKKKK